METERRTSPHRDSNGAPIGIRRLTILTGFSCFIVLLGLGWQTKHLTTLGFLLMLIAALVVLHRLFDRDSQPSPRLPWPIWIVGLTLFFSFLFSTDNYTSSWMLLQWVGLAMLLWLTLQIASSRYASILLISLMILGWIIGLIGLVDFFQLQDPSLGVASTFGWKNTFGGALLLLFPLFLFAGFPSISAAKWKRFLTEALVILLGVNLVLTFSQGSWLIALIVVVVGLVLQGAQRDSAFFHRLGRVIVGVGIAVSVLWFLHPILRDLPNLPTIDFRESSSVQSLSFENRFDYWKTTWSMIQDYPWTGVGGGNFATLYPQFQQNSWSFASDPHHFPLRIFAEGGIFVFLSFTLLLVWLLAFFRLTIQRSRKQSSPERRSIVLGLQLSILASLLHAFIDMDYSVFALLALLVVEIGMLLAIGHQLGVSLWSPLLRFSFPRSTASLAVSFGGFVVFAGLVFSFTLSESYTLQAKTALATLQDRTAITLAKKAIRFSPWNGQAYLVLSDATLSTIYGQAPSDAKERSRYQSLVYAQTAAKLQPQHPGPHLQLAKIAQVSFAADSAGFQTAINEGAEALRLDGWNFPQFYITQAVNLHRRNQTAEAMALLEQLLNRFSPDAQAKMFTVDRAAMDEQLTYAKELLDRYSLEQ